MTIEPVSNVQWWEVAEAILTDRWSSFAGVVDECTRTHAITPLLLTLKNYDDEQNCCQLCIFEYSLQFFPVLNLLLLLLDFLNMDLPSRSKLFGSKESTV